MTSPATDLHSATELTSRPGDDVIAVEGGRQLTVRAFLQRVDAVAAALPPGDLIFNLCTNRLNFTIGFCALIAAGRSNVIPPNTRSATLAGIERDLGHSLPVLHDGDASGAASALNLREHGVRTRNDSASVPRIAAQQLCSLSFTSGSTGTAKPVRKSWHTITASTRINADIYLMSSAARQDLVATVPAQHMYGLETSVFLPLFNNVCVHGGRPLFPADLLQALESSRAPRVLVTTPLHARALLASEINYPPVQVILSATAPLDAELARAMEQRFDAEVREIYGSTETGSLACRRTAQDDNWTLFPGFQASSHEGEVTRISADHLAEPVELPDLLQWSAADRFRLLGRQSDMINIAGKRGSLGELNGLLLAIPGVEDGVVFEPRADGAGCERLAALVVAPTLSREELLAALRERIDDLFLPRPLLFVEALPRDGTGKLPRRALLELFEQRRH